MGQPVSALGHRYLAAPVLLPMKLHLDFETRSAISLQECGAIKYAMHPSTEILCMGWGHSPTNVTVWDAEEARGGAKFGGFKERLIVAHNAAFEYAIYNYILHKRYGWPARWDPALWDCTMARAAQVGLPLHLADLGAALQVKTPKDLDGKRVMLQLCKPIGFDPLGEPVYDEDPTKFQRLYQYNETDVLSEMEIDGLLPELMPHERAIWERDLIINNRGVAVDVPLCQKATHIAGALTDKLNARLREITGGQIDKATQVMALKVWLDRQGVKGIEKLDKVAVTDLLARTDIPEIVRETVSIRRQVGKSSTAKYVKAVETACDDGRVRGVLQYHAAHTGRWGGRLIQPQNYPKGFKVGEQNQSVERINTGNPEAYDFFYGEKAMDALSNTLRGTIVAAPGKTFVSADYNAIEARTLFWLAGDASALATYHRGESPYVDMARYIYNNEAITKETHPKEYDIGKRTILGCGYGMGAEKFKDNVYAETAKDGKPIVISEELAERAVKAYRTKYKSVVSMWYATEAAAIGAVRNPGVAYPACGGKVLFGMSRDRRFLVAKLPSGRYLWYYKPEIRVVDTPWGEKKEEVCYWGEHPKTKKWCLLKMYGGSFVENITQAIARDIMAHGMQLAEAGGFPIVLTVHDELLAEVEDRDWEDETGAWGWDDTLASFMSKMCTLPYWAPGLPLKAEGWVGKRYHK